MSIQIVEKSGEGLSRVFGVTVQGLFLRRRTEVAAEYGALIADEIITPRKVIQAILSGPMSDRVVAMIARHVEQAIDRNAGLARPLVVLTVAHLNHTPEDCRDDNLKAMCQACHLNYDRDHHAETAARTRAEAQASAGQGVLL